jgi:Holliday junction resolvase RusA-like endonuclease
MIYEAFIPCRLPGLNEYTNANRRNRYAGAKMKKDTEEVITWHLARLPKMEKPVEIDFHWIEPNRRRDLDNVAFAKKFILDALVKSGKLKDDNRRHVTAFRDTFEIGATAGVKLTIREVEK